MAATGCNVPFPAINMIKVAQVYCVVSWAHVPLQTTEARVIIAWLADVTFTYHNRHMDKREIRLIVFGVCICLSYPCPLIASAGRHLAEFHGRPFPGTELHRRLAMHDACVCWDNHLPTSTNLKLSFNHQP